MSTRREFMALTAGSAIAAVSAPAVSFSEKDAQGLQRGPRIKSAVRRDATLLRFNDHHGSFHMSWAADDKLYVTLNDGLGVGEDSNAWLNNHMFTISGGPQNAVLEGVPGYPKKSMWETHGKHARSPWYNAWGTLALDQHIYQFVSILNRPFSNPDGSRSPDARFFGAKLVYSPDGGRTWHNHDGSTPIVWEPYEKYSRETMVFFDEPQGAFSLLSILQMGRNYEANRDGYVYVYAPNGNTAASMHELVMFRVPKAQLLRRSAYEYFGGLRSNGDATWVKDINARGIVHAFPTGWIGQPPVVPFGWFPSVVYNAPLGLYMMANWGQGWTAEDMWFGKPCYLGLWAARNPWGPWTQFYEETVWTPRGDPRARAYQPQIVPKWIAPDGKSFWLAWPEIHIVDQQAMQQFADEFRDIGTPTAEQAKQAARLTRRARPYYGINVQRIDLTVA